MKFDIGGIFKPLLILVIKQLKHKFLFYNKFIIKLESVHQVG